MNVNIINNVDRIYYTDSQVFKKTAKAAIKDPSALRVLRICKLIDDCLRLRVLENLSKFYLSPVVGS